MRINRLEDQHESILEIINETKSLINATRFEKNASEISKNINILAGKLKMHLASEDKFLYPSFLKHDNQDLKNKANEYINEMGNLNSIFNDFKNKYNTKSKILENLKDLKIESSKVFNNIEERMHREDTDLYKLAKSL